MCLSAKPRSFTLSDLILLSDSTYEDSLMKQQEDTDISISDEEQEGLEQQLGQGPSRGLDGRDGNLPRPVLEPPALGPSPPPLATSTPPPVASDAPPVTVPAALGVSTAAVASSGAPPATFSQAASTGLATAASTSLDLVTAGLSAAGWQPSLAAPMQAGGPGPAPGSLFGTQPPPAVASQAAPIQVPAPQPQHSGLYQQQLLVQGFNQHQHQPLAPGPGQQQLGQPGLFGAALGGGGGQPQAAPAPGSGPTQRQRSLPAAVGTPFQGQQHQAAGGGLQPPAGIQQPPAGAQQPPAGGQQPPAGVQQPLVGGQPPQMQGPAQQAATMARSLEDAGFTREEARGFALRWLQDQQQPRQQQPQPLMAGGVPPEVLTLLTAQQQSVQVI